MAEKSGYGETLNLPRTQFPMKADLTRREPAWLDKWEKMKLYERMRAARRGAKSFILHDGPPYANGPSHLGHLLNNVLKDAVVRYKFLRGFDVPFVPGWDCHGQPIEHQYLRTSGLNVSDIDPLELRRACHAYAAKWMRHQREERKRVGALGDWENPYSTMDKRMEAKEIESVGKLIREGYIFRGKKPVLWCSTCETALAENAVEHGPHVAPSIYVKFKIRSWPPALASLKDLKKPAYAVIWTTTPWTLPANVALAFNADLKYDLVDTGEETLLLAHDLAEGVLALAQIVPKGTLATEEGRKFEGLMAENPLVKSSSRGILADHVTLDAGTGIVHTAPGHGEEDYIVGVEYRLPILAPVDGKGRFTSEYPEFEGREVFEANADLTGLLKTKGALLHESAIEHSYPFCWRCKNPVIFRATEQWFISLKHKQLKKRSMDAVGRVNWFPANGRERMTMMLEQRPDWCISRQRSWGVPIPVFYCLSCESVLANEDSLNAVRDWVAQEGTDVWWLKDAEALLPAGIRCASCGGRKFRKETDTLDVWFDSGVTHTSVLRAEPELAAPADLYLEATDQFRGWFQSSLLTSMALHEDAPYRAVFTHGWVLDPQGDKMSKSLGNVLSLEEAVNRWGADVMRLWGLLENFTEDMRISEEIMARVTDAYRKLRNTLRFLLGNMAQEEYEVEREALQEVDRWMLWRLKVLIREVTEDLDAYAFYRGGQRLIRFCTVDLSSFYLDLLKDRLYASKKDDPGRRAAQAVLGRIFSALVRMLAPYIPFTADEALGHAPAWVARGSGSVQLMSWPEEPAVKGEAELGRKWEAFTRVRETVLKQVEAARQAGEVSSQLESRITLAASGKLREFLESLSKDLPELLVVSQVEVADLAPDAEKQMSAEGGGQAISVRQAEGGKCPRCWLIREELTAPAAGRVCRRCASVLEARR